MNEEDEEVRKKQVWALLLVLVLLVFSLVACNGSGKVDVTKLDADALLKEFAQKMQNIQSMNGQISFSFDLTAPDENGVPIQGSIRAEGTGSSFKKPLKQKIDIDVVIKAQGKTVNIKMQLYLMEENGQIKVYYDFNSDTPSLVNPEDMMKSMPFKNGDTLGPVQTPAAGQNQLENYLTDPRMIGAETVNGRETIHIQADLDISKAFEQAQDAMDDSMPAEQLASFKIALRMFGDIQTDIWIDAVTHDPVQYSIDMGDQINNFMQMIMSMQSEGQGSGVKFGDIEAKATYTDFNNVKNFEVPIGLKASDGTETKTQT